MRYFGFIFSLLCCVNAVFGQVADSLSVDDLLASGKKMEQELRYAEALGIYQQCFAKDTANLDAALSLADVASTLGMADVAERNYRRILLRDTVNFYARYRLARLYASQENYRKAIAEYETLYLADTTSSRPVLGKLIGDCYAQIDSTYLAAVYYNESFEANPADAAVDNSLAYTLLTLGGAHLAFLPIDAAQTRLAPLAHGERGGNALARRTDRRRLPPFLHGLAARQTAVGLSLPDGPALRGSAQFFG